MSAAPTPVETRHRPVRLASPSPRRTEARKLAVVVAAAFTGPWLVWGSRLAQAHGLIDWHLPQGVALWSMTVPVLLAAAACWGRSFLRDLGRRLLAWRVPARAYGYALGFPVAVAAIAVGVTRATGHQVATGVVLSLPSALGFLAFGTLLYLLTEELMWRGVLLPRLRARVGVGPAGLTVGVVWAVWHIPLLSIPGETDRGLPLPGFLVLVVATSVVMTYLMELSATASWWPPHSTPRSTPPTPTSASSVEAPSPFGRRSSSPSSPQPPCWPVTGGPSPRSH